MPTDHIPQCHISVVLEDLQGWLLHHLPGQPVPLHHCFGEVLFPNIRPEPLLVQLKAFTLRYLMIPNFLVSDQQIHTLPALSCVAQGSC